MGSNPIPPSPVSHLIPPHVTGCGRAHRCRGVLVSRLTRQVVQKGEKAQLASLVGVSHDALSVTVHDAFPLFPPQKKNPP